MKFKNIAVISIFTIAAAIIANPVSANPAAARKALIDEVTIRTLQSQMQKGDFTALELTNAALARIAKYDDDPKGSKLNAVLTINPKALDQARAADLAINAGQFTPMLGIPILVKDNVDTNDEMPTTAGSVALKDNITHRDNPAIAKLRASGAIILGKTNLSEWANMRSETSISGWSGLGGSTKNPYDLARTPCGSSSGTGAAIAASMAVIGIGSETDGSVVCPSNMNALVGLKPTVGLISRTHVVPISHTQDTLGPMGRNVEDVAIMLGVMAGSDNADSATKDADIHKADYLGALNGASLANKRLGVVRDNIGNDNKTKALFERNLQKLKDAGAILVEIPTSRIPSIDDAELLVLLYELKVDLNAYLATTPPSVKARTLEQLIVFNRENSSVEMPFFAQELFEKSQATNGYEAPEYIHALNRSRDLAEANLNVLFDGYNLDALISPTMGPAWFIDNVYGDVYGGRASSGLPAVAGLPHLTVPMGQIQGLPVGLSFIGKRWDEAKLLALGFAFEKLKRERIAPKLD